VRAAQIRLLYSNSITAFRVTILAVLVLAYFQWNVVRHALILGWAPYMLLVSVGRFVLVRRFWRATPGYAQVVRWGAAYAAGAGLAAGGWGVAGILLYPEASLMHQIFLVFVLGGMMLGGASLLAPRPEAFLAFLIPTGLLPAIRLMYRCDEAHLAMGLLAVVFTAATLTTTWRFYRTIESSLDLRFENQDLVEDLRAAKNQTEALNQQLELRVQERTAELRRAAELLQAEIARRERMEDELLRVRNLESLGLLAGGIAHDFNNFLTIVQSNIELAKMRLDPAEAVQEILEQTAGACQRAASLSSQLTR
jgi:signal transduction histidine kinase